MKIHHDIYFIYLFLTGSFYLALCQVMNTTDLVKPNGLGHDPRELRLEQVILVADYFHNKSMSYVSGLLCWSYAELAVLWRELSSRGIRFAAWRKLRAQSESERVRRKSALAAVQHVVHAGRAPMGVLLDMACSYAEELIEQSSQQMQFAATRKWLILESEETHCDEFEIVKALPSIRALEQANISVDAEITVAVRCELNTSTSLYHLYDLFNYGHLQGGKLNTTSMGRWNAVNGLSVWLDAYKYERRCDFGGVTLRAVTVLPQSAHLEVLLVPGSSVGISTSTKIGNAMMVLQRDRLNFGVTYVVKDKWVGPTNTDDNSSVSSAMYRHEGDISASCLRVFPDRLYYMEPVFALTFIQTKFFYRTPSDGVGALRNEFGRPFAPTMWAAVGGAAIACGAVLAAAGQIQRMQGAGQFAVFTVLATTFQQVFEMGPPKFERRDIEKQAPVEIGNRLSGRLIIFVSSLSSLLLFNFYTSSVVSFLLSAPPPAINTIKDLIESPLELIFEDIGYTRSWIEVPNYYYRQDRPPEENILRENKVQKAKKKHPLFLTVKDGIELMRHGGVAYHTEPDPAHAQISATFTAAEVCDFGAMEMMDRVPLYMVAQARSPYKEIFLVGLLMATERGHLTRIQRRFGSPAPTCSVATVPKAVALGSFAPAVIALLGAYVLSMLLLLAEVFMYRLNSSHIQDRMKPPPISATLSLTRVTDAI